MAGQEMTGPPRTISSAQVDREPVGAVTEEERDEIQLLFERRNGLVELAGILVRMNEEELQRSGLYDKLVLDLGNMNSRFHQWWDQMASKYQWRNVKGYRWEINFDSCEVHLKKIPQ